WLPLPLLLSPQPTAISAAIKNRRFIFIAPLLPVRDQIGQVRSAPASHQVVACFRRVPAGAGAARTNLGSRRDVVEALAILPERVELLERVGEALARGSLGLQEVRVD